MIKLLRCSGINKAGVKMERHWGLLATEDMMPLKHAWSHVTQQLNHNHCITTLDPSETTHPPFTTVNKDSWVSHWTPQHWTTSKILQSSSRYLGLFEDGTLFVTVQSLGDTSASDTRSAEGKVSLVKRCRSEEALHDADITNFKQELNVKRPFSLWTFYM